MRYAAFSLALVGCHASALGPSAAEHDPCRARTPQVLATGARSASSFAVVDDNVYFSTQDQHVRVVSRRGGAAHDLESSHALVAAPDGNRVLFGGVDTDGYVLVDQDPTNGQQRTFRVSSNASGLAASPTDIVGWGIDVNARYYFEHVDRATGHEDVLEADALLPAGPGRVVGGHAFFEELAGGILDVDFETGAVMPFGSPGGPIASDGFALLVGQTERFAIDSGAEVELASVPHLLTTGVVAITADTHTVYWSSFDDAALHVTSRDGSMDCELSLGIPAQVRALEMDGEAVYAVLDDGAGSLLRVEK